METVQCVSKNEPMLRQIADVRAIPDVGGYPTYYDVVATSPLTTGMRESQENEPKEQPHRERERERLEAATRDTCHPHRAAGLRRVRKAGRKKKKDAALKQAAQ